MANIGTALNNWSTTEASNQPDGADSATIAGDMRAIQAAVRYALGASDTIASATTCDIGSKSSGYLTISGTTTITSLGSTATAGLRKTVTFSGALTLTHHATDLILPTGGNITTVAGDHAEFICTATGKWTCLWYAGKSVRAANLTASGGTIDGTVIGGSSAAAGTFTTLTSTGNTTLGDAATDTTTINSTVVQEYDSATANQAVWNLRSYQNGNANVAPYMMLSAAKNTKATPQAIGSGEVLGAISFEGYDGSAWSGRQARIYAATTEAWSASANGSKILFETTPNASTTMATRVEIGQNGYVTIVDSNVSTNGTAKFQVGGPTADYNAALGSMAPQVAIVGGNDLNRLEIGMDNSGATAVGFLQSRNTSTGAATLSFNYGGGNIDMGNGKLYVDAANNRVGLGTSSPAQTLSFGAYGAMQIPTGNCSGYVTGQYDFGDGYDYYSVAKNFRRTSSSAGTIPQSDHYTSELLFYGVGGPSGATEVIRFGISTAKNTAPTSRFVIDFNGAGMTHPTTIGYMSGSGGTVTQATSKSTSVTLNKPAGKITMNNAALASGASVQFVVNNSLVSTADTVVVNAYANANYRVETCYAQAGLFGVRVTNVTAGSLSEALDIHFTVIKGATA